MEKRRRRRTRRRRVRLSHFCHLQACVCGHGMMLGRNVCARRTTTTDQSCPLSRALTAQCVFDARRRVGPKGTIWAIPREPRDPMRDVELRGMFHLGNAHVTIGRVTSRERATLRPFGGGCGATLASLTRTWMSIKAHRKNPLPPSSCSRPRARGTPPPRTECTAR